MSRVHQTAYVAEGARLVGDVTLGEGVGVWYNAVLRGDECSVTVGAFSNIQDCCVLHGDQGGATVVGDWVTVGHGAILHGCSVGSGALIGMGATVLDGAQVGENAMVAAGALVTPGSVIPAGMLAVGCPAKVKRPLTQAEIDANRANTQLYVDLARKAREA